MDFGQLIPLKQVLLKTAAKRFLAQPKFRDSADYEAFLKLHGSHWQNDYALFRVLKSLHNERPWPQWDPGPGDALFIAMKDAMGTLPIVAEDLGVITPEVNQLRHNHCLPGMVVLQFEVGNPDFDIASISANSVCYTGTHDNDTTVGWFAGNGDDSRSADEIEHNQTGALKQSNGSPKTIVLDMIKLAFSSNAAVFRWSLRHG